MKSRERVFRAIELTGPDRPPVSHGILPATQYKYGAALEEILAGVQEDFGWSLLPDMGRGELPALYRGGRNRDDFGTLWDTPVEGMSGIPVEWPLADWSAYASYQWPEFSAGPPSGRLYSGHMSGRSDDYYARGGWITFFEQMQQMRGMESLLMDLATESREFLRLRDDLLEFNLGWIDKWTALEYDGIHFADDWGTERGLMISVDAWRRLFKPAYARMFRKVTDAGMHVHFHCDGDIFAIMGDLIDCGVRVINCQANVIGLERIRKRYAGAVCFRTDLDRQRIVPFGTPDDVRRHVKDVFDNLGTPRGGIIACGELSPDIPLENIKAMYEAFARYLY
jgi:uroporphyrinogen decarboxylase